MTLRLTAIAVVLVGSAGCIQDLHQVAGTGAIYTTRCSSDMVAREGGYFATCSPDDCAPGFSAGPVSHVVVALDPGRKVIGVAERVCIQDLARASENFNTAIFEEAAPLEAEPVP